MLPILYFINLSSRSLIIVLPPVLSANLAAAGMPIDPTMSATASVAFACGGASASASASASPSCASAPPPPSFAGLSADAVLGLAIGGAVFGAALIGVGLYFFCRRRTAELLAARAKIGGAFAGGDAMLDTEMQHRGSGSSSSGGSSVALGDINIARSHRESVQDTTSFSYVERPPM